MRIESLFNLVTQSESYYAIALKKGNTGLKKQIDKVLSALKQDGHYDTIFNRWFHETELQRLSNE